MMKKMKVIEIFFIVWQLCASLENDVPEDVQTSTVANFVVHPELPASSGSSNTKPKFEFMPHFDQSNYEFMIPEGKNNQESVAAVVQFYGLLTKPTPEFEIMGDSHEWFKIGDVETIKEPNYMISSIPILNKAGIDVVYDETNKGVYSFKIVAKDSESEPQANINVEVLSFDPVVPKVEKIPIEKESGVKSLEPNTLITEELTLPTETPTTTEATEVLDFKGAETKANDSETSFATIEDEIRRVTDISIDDLEEKLRNEASPDVTSLFSTAFKTELITQPQETTLEAEITSITDISIDQLEERLRNEAVEFTPTIPVEVKNIASEQPKVEEDAIDFEPIAPALAPITLPPIIVQLIDTKTRETTNEISIDNTIKAGFVLKGFEIRAVLNESVSHELLQVSVEPEGILDVQPHFVLSKMPSQLIVKDPKSLLTFDNQMFKIKVRYAEVETESAAELLVSLNTSTQQKTTIEFEKYHYEFVVPENQRFGEVIGDIKAKPSEPLIYALIGPDSELFSISDGVISVNCSQCFDYEKQKAYYLIAMATTLSGVTSNPVTIVIGISDINDNSPVLSFPDKIVKIQDGRVLEPFLLKVKDKDTNEVNKNTIIFEGSAAKFLSLELVSADAYKIQVTGIPEIGGYVLDVVAKDSSNSALIKSMKSMKIEVLSSAGKAKFGQARYERKLAADKLYQGNPLVQLQFVGEAIENVQFIFFDGNPGWLSLEDFGGNIFVGDVPAEGVSPGEYTVTVAALSRQTQQIIDKCEISIIIEGTQVSKTIFASKVVSITVPKGIDKDVVMSPLAPNEKRQMTLLFDSIYAWGDAMEIVHVPTAIITIDRSSLIVNAIALQNLRGLQFQLVATDNPNDRTLITVYVATNAEKFAETKRLRSKPKFSAPWVSENEAIKIMVPEETPLEHPVIHLYAFNPETQEIINNVTLEGEMAEYFAYDTTKNSLVINKLIDYEALKHKTFNLKLIASNPDSQTAADLIVTVQNLDDNRPQIYLLDNLTLVKPLQLQIAENSPPGKILIEFKIHDADAEADKRKYDRFQFNLIGDIASNFQIQQKEKSYILSTSLSIALDREVQSQGILMLEVRDSAGNADVLPMIIKITDENDNRPMMESVHKHLEVIESWPVGTLLSKVSAVDKDEGENKQVQFSLKGPASKFLSIDAGEIRINNSLHGLAAFEPYRFQVIATDSGSPLFSSESDFDVRIIETSSLQIDEEQSVKFTNPPIDLVFALSEDILPNTRILTAEAAYLSETADRTVRYFLKPISPKDDGWLSINPNNGDIFVQSGLDYERQRFVTMLTKKRESYLRAMRQSNGILHEKNPKYKQLEDRPF